MPTLNRNTQVLTLASSFLLLLAVVYADNRFGDKFDVSLFYLLPIAWCSLHAGRGAAMLFAVSCAVARFGIGLVPQLNGIPRPELMWRISMELLFFLIFTAMLLKMHQMFEEERALARTDPLTRLFNARAFYDAVGAERERVRRYERTMSLIYFDLDNFKTVNDRLGHHVGDQLLKTVGETLRANVRQVDVAARLGGDEFALLLPETDEVGARVVLDRLRDRLLAAMTEKSWPVTCSMGCCTFREVPPDVQTMVQAADAAMYRAKHGGKNRLVMETWIPGDEVGADSPV